MKISFEKRFFFIFLLIAVAIFAFSIITYRNDKSIVNSNFWVNHTQQVLYNTEKILSDLKDIETAVRGYVITRDTAFLDPYYQSKDSIIINIQKLAALTKDNPLQQLRIDTLYGLAVKRLALCTAVAKYTFNKTGFNDSLLAIVHAGKSIMDKIRKSVIEIGSEEKRLLTLREKGNNENYNRLKSRFYILFGVILFIFILAYFIMRYNFSVLKRDSKLLIQLNSTLTFLNKKIDDIIEGISDPFFALDKNWKFIYLNTAAQKTLGYEKGSLIDNNIFEIFPRYKENITGQNMIRVEQTQKPLSFEAYDDFFGYWQDLAIYPTTEGMTVFIRDATKRKANEKELLITKAFLEEINEVAIVGGWEVDLTQGTVYWTAVTGIIHEIEPGYVPDLNTAINFFKEGEQRDILNKLLEQAMVDGKEYETELQIITAKGNEKWVRVKGKTELENNICIRVFGTVQDIDGQKRLDYKLKQSEEQFRTAFEYSAIGMALVSTDGKWIEVNESLCNIVGYTRTELLKLTFRDITHPDDLENDLKILMYLVAGKLQNHKLEKRYFHKDGHIIWILLVLSIVKDQYGKIIHFIAQIQDITDLKQNERELNCLNLSIKENNRELALKNEELEQFAYVASHDLQEPLRMITGFLSKIEKKYNDLLDDDGRKYIGFAVDGAARMRQMIIDILDYSRIGNAPSKFTTINLNVLVEEMIKTHLVNAEDQDAVIEMDELPIIAADKTSMEQLFSNFISNALKYQPPGNKPVVKIKSEDHADHWKFSIADNGIGIDPKSFNKVFNVFQRLHNKTQYSGSGIGLAICKKIIDNLKGEIWIESAPGMGSTFYFTIMK